MNCWVVAVDLCNVIVLLRVATLDVKHPRSDIKYVWKWNVQRNIN